MRSFVGSVSSGVAGSVKETRS